MCDDFFDLSADELALVLAIGEECAEEARYRRNTERMLAEDLEDGEDEDYWQI